MHPFQPSPSKALRQTTLAQFYKSHENQIYTPNRNRFPLQQLVMPQQQYQQQQYQPLKFNSFQIQQDYSIPRVVMQQPETKFEQYNVKYNPLQRIALGASGYVNDKDSILPLHPYDIGKRQRQLEQFDMISGKKKECQSILSELVSKTQWSRQFEKECEALSEEDEEVVEVEHMNEPMPTKEQLNGDSILENNEEDLQDSNNLMGQMQKRTILQMSKSSNLSKQLFVPKVDNANIFAPKQSQSDAFHFLPANSQQLKSSQEILDELKLKQFREQSAHERNKLQKQKSLDDDDNIKISTLNRLQQELSNGGMGNKQQKIDDFIHSYKLKEKKGGMSSLLEQNTHNFSAKNLTQPLSINAIFAKQKNNLFVNQTKDHQSNSHSQSDSDDESGEDGYKKKKLNDGSDQNMGKYYSSKGQEKQAKKDKFKTKEDEKKAKIRQELIEEGNSKRVSKQEEERKIQRQKLVHMKKMEELRKQRNEQQNTLEYRKMMKEQFKNMNLEEKLGELQGNNNINLNKSEKGGEGAGNEKDKTGFELMNSLKVNRTHIDDYESEEERKNIFSLIHFIFSQNYNQEDIVRVENKRIPNKFSGWKEYFTIFEYLFLMECVSNIQQIYAQFKYNDNYSSPLNCYIKLISTKENSNGFLEFQVYRSQDKIIESNRIENGEYNQTEEDYYTLSTLRNHAVLISNFSEPDLQLLSQKDFSAKKGFLFFGWVVPPETNDPKSVLKLCSDIDGTSFKNAFQKNDEKIFVHIFNFQKMTTFLREYLSIKNMRYNGLNRFIYDPAHIVETKTPVSNPQVFLPLFEELKKQYNSSQFQSIKEICLTNRGLCMLQGPPGTGKTHTLLGLLSGLFFYIKKNPETTKPKIMICAPSNTAVDEIVSRIIDSGLHLPGGKVYVNVIRIGAIDYVPSESVKKASLEYQIEKMMIAKGISSSDKVQKEMLIDLQIAMVKLNQEIDKAKKEMQGQELRNILDNLCDKKRSLRQKISQQKLEKVARRDQIKSISDQILGLADVVCCTLASSISEKLERFKNQIEVLIVDEAAQCTEPNNIIPLFYEPNKMVLIGDPKQLPATTFQPDSNVTKYNRSLFERIIDNNIKPYFLDQQYRMHPNIREFPSSQFYEDKLKDGDLVLNRPFPDYLQRLEGRNVQFIDISFSRERINNKSYENECEAEASIQLCLQLIDEIERSKKNNPSKNETPSIGIITPYKQQTKLINSMMRVQIPKGFHKHIQVNTVDSFQGQEKDIIIFTTVRANSSNVFKENMIGFLQDERRMNVALTRARFCLVILGHSDTLNSNPIWGSLVDFMAKQKRYGKLKSRDELNEVGELLMKGKLIGGSSREYVKKDWGEQYKLAILKSKQVNELKLTDFEIESIPNHSNTVLNSDGKESNQEDQQIEIEGEQDAINSENSMKEEQKEEITSALKEGSEMKEEILGDSDDTNRQDIEIKKCRSTNMAEEQIEDYQITLEEKQMKEAEAQAEEERQKEAEIINQWDEKTNQNQKRTGVTMKEAIENMQSEMIMSKRSSQGLSALLKRTSVKKNAVMQEEESREPLKVEETQSNVLENCNDYQKGLMRKIFLDKQKSKMEDIVEEREVEEYDHVVTEDIYAKIRQQKIESLKAKKQMHHKSNEIREKSERDLDKVADHSKSKKNHERNYKESSREKDEKSNNSEKSDKYKNREYDDIILQPKNSSNTNSNNFNSNDKSQDKKKEKNQFELTYGLDRLMQRKEVEEPRKACSLADLMLSNSDSNSNSKSKSENSLRSFNNSSSNNNINAIYEQISKQREVQPERDSFSNNNSNSNSWQKSKERSQTKEIKDDQFKYNGKENIEQKQPAEQKLKKVTLDDSDKKINNNPNKLKGLDSLLKKNESFSSFQKFSYSSNNDQVKKATTSLLLNNIYLKKN